MKTKRVAKAFFALMFVFVPMACMDPDDVAGDEIYTKNITQEEGHPHVVTVELVNDANNNSLQKEPKGAESYDGSLIEDFNVLSQEIAPNPFGPEIFTPEVLPPPPINRAPPLGPGIFTETGPFPFMRSPFADHPEVAPWHANYIGSYGALPSRFQNEGPFLYSFDISPDADIFNDDDFNPFKKRFKKW